MYNVMEQTTRAFLLPRSDRSCSIALNYRTFTLTQMPVRCFLSKPTDSPITIHPYSFTIIYVSTQTRVVKYLWGGGGISGFFFLFYGSTALYGPGPPRFVEVPRSHSDTPHSVGLLWTRDQPVAETSTWQHTTLTTERHPWPRRDSDPRSQ
jgi:hypothetical protein